MKKTNGIANTLLIGVVLAAIILLGKVTGCNAQCNVYAKGNIDTAKSLLPTIETFMQFKMPRVLNINIGNRIMYADSAHYCEFVIVYNIESKLNGSEVVKTPVNVEKLIIKGPAERIDKLFQYFISTYKSCGEVKTAGQWMKYQHQLIVWQTSTYDVIDLPVKEIVIQYQ